MEPSGQHSSGASAPAYSYPNTPSERPDRASTEASQATPVDLKLDHLCESFEAQPSIRHLNSKTCKENHNRISAASPEPKVSNKTCRSSRHCTHLSPFCCHSCGVCAGEPLVTRIFCLQCAGNQIPGSYPAIVSPVGGRCPFPLGTFLPLALVDDRAAKEICQSIPEITVVPQPARYQVAPPSEDTDISRNIRTSPTSCHNSCVTTPVPFNAHPEIGQGVSVEEQSMEHNGGRLDDENGRGTKRKERSSVDRPRKK